MWKPKWLRKQPQLKNENVIRVLQYNLHHAYDGTKVVLTVHLPSKRVSEKYFDSSGTLKKYVHSSAVADKHISYLCGKDSKLIDLMEETNSTDNPILKTTNYYHIILTTMLVMIITYGLLIILADILR